MNPEKPWGIQRHGGNHNHSWRTVAEFATQEQAEERYAVILEEMRQGGLKLTTPEAVTIKSHSAPRLRTRW